MTKSNCRNATDTLELLMFGSEGCPESSANAQSGCKTRWASNPLVLIDDQMRFLESGVSTKQEWAESVIFWANDALDCISRHGEHYRWSIFEAFDGRFTSRSDSQIGQLLRDMAKVNEFMAWKPYLEQIRAIAAATRLPMCSPQRGAVPS